MSSIDFNLGVPTRENPQLQSRNQLPHFLTACGLTGDGVEIGVQFGNFTERLLKFSKLRRVFSIDPWTHLGEQYVDRANVGQEVQDYRYLQTVNRCIPYGTRSVIMRMASEDAAPLFPNGSLDFIYIDANHQYEMIKRDIDLWWPKIRPGGLFAGHDYLDGFINDSHFGVKRAVDEFIAMYGVKLHVTNAMSGWEVDWPSWYCFKENFLSSYDIKSEGDSDILRF
jgi:hypothetical protein